MHWNRITRSLALVFMAGIVLVSAAAIARTQTNTPIATLTATSMSVKGAGDTVRLTLLRWSTETERDRLLAAWNAPAAPAGGGARGEGARGGAAPRGGAPGGGAAGAGAPAAGGARGGAPAGGAGGGALGRGGARGGGASGGDAAPARTPESALLAALQEAPTIGYLWTSEAVGYSLRYAYRVQLSDGGERIVLATDRRLGAANPQLWQPVGSAAPTDYPFTVIELRLNRAGQGEGKASLTAKVTADNEAKTIALEGYAAAPVVLQGVKR